MDENLIREMREAIDRANAQIQSGLQKGLTQGQFDMESHLIRQRLVEEVKELGKKYGVRMWDWR